MNNIHVLMIPYPAQGHVIPLMELARCFTSNGLKVTFVNTEVAHKRVMSALSEKDGDGSSDLMQMVWIPDGMEPLADRNDMGKLIKSRHSWETGQLGTSTRGPKPSLGILFLLLFNRRIFEYKSSYYSFYLPIACALLLFGDNLDDHVLAKDVLIEMGIYYQVQNDYLDTYGDPNVFGKTGTDIEECKCS
nr:chrysanthemyl diphosphate synthase [Tanacetum cinerariifolium]